MTDFEKLTFWVIILLLCLVSLTTLGELRRFVKRAYRHTVDVMKWYPYLPFITNREEKGKHHQPVDSSEFSSLGALRRRIFPRSRRST